MAHVAGRVPDTVYAEIAGNTITYNTASGINSTESRPWIHDNLNISSNDIGINMKAAEGGVQTTENFNHDSLSAIEVVFNHEGDTIGYNLTRYENNPLDSPFYDVPGSDSYGMVHPDILYFDNVTDGDGYKYWMYYTGSADLPAGGSDELYWIENPCLVRSNDGINFTDAGIKSPLFKFGRSTSGWDCRNLADEDIIRFEDFELPLISG